MQKRNRADNSIPCCHPHLLQDAERPGRHSFAEQRNEKKKRQHGLYLKDEICLTEQLVETYIAFTNAL